MVMVSVSETFDLHTEVNKMTLIGIHTPTKELIQKSYPGLVMNCRYFRVDHVDVELSTAQTLPLGVDQIGLDADKIHPQDMMNPILYKATSNDSWSTLEARLMGLYEQAQMNSQSIPEPPLEGNMAFAENDQVTGIADEHGVYYSLLAHHDGFRASHPQQGVSLRGLVPLVFEKLYSFGENQYNGASDVADTFIEGVNNSIVRQPVQPRTMRGIAKRMPKMNTTYLTGTNGGSDVVNQSLLNGVGEGTPRNIQALMPDIPPVMLAAIILPPVSATTGILYYRMVCRAYIEFSDVRPIQEITSFAQMDSALAPLVYHTDYNEQSKAMDHLTDLVDLKNGEIQKIMEGR